MPKPFVETKSDVKYQSPYVRQVSNETQTNSVIYPSPKPQQTIVKDIYLMSDPVRYNYLYNMGLGFIPTYYTYERRRRLEDAIRSAVMRGLSMNKPQWEIEAIIKNIINDIDYGTTTNITIESPKKTVTARKPSKKVKVSKKAKSSKKKISKKKVSKKKSKKTSKKSKSKKSKKVAKKM